MASIKEKVTEALNETRLLTLGCTVLFGFQLNAAFHPGFERIPSHARGLDGAALALMMGALALLMAPAPFHRLVAEGEDRPAVHRFTTRMTEWALAPFSLAIASDVFIVVEKGFGVPAGIALGALFGVLALFFFYLVGLICRSDIRVRSQAMSKIFEEPEPTSLHEKIKTLMTEARVNLPGVQALLGFQFTVVLSDAFDRLPPSSVAIHIASLILVGIAVILLMAPAAFHRIAADGEDLPEVDTFGVWAILGSMIPLAVGLCGDFYVVLAKVTDAAMFSAAAAALAFLVFAGLWGAYPLWRRRRK